MGLISQCLIISVTPTTGLSFGKYTEFTITVNYDLTSRETATLMLGFNNLADPGLIGAGSNSYVIINKGKGQYVYTFSAIAKDWGSQDDFYVEVYMTDNPVPTKAYRAMISDKFIIIPKH